MTSATRCLTAVGRTIKLIKVRFGTFRSAGAVNGFGFTVARAAAAASRELDVEHGHVPVL